MTQPLAIITNCKSTRNLRGDAWIEPLLTNEKHVAHFKVVDVGEIPGVLGHCAAMGAETIVVNGGDGTAGLVFAGLLNHNVYRRLPALALLPAGKTNMTAAGWSMTGKPEDALRALLECRRDARLSEYAVERPVLCVYRGGTHLPLYGAFFGAAEMVDGILFCRRHIYPLNMPNAISHTAAIGILLWRSMLARRGGGNIEVCDDDGLAEAGSFFAMVVTALDQLLFGVRLMPDGRGKSSAPLTYVSLRPGVFPMLRAMGSLVSREVGPGPGRTMRITERLALNFTGTYTLDGELYETRASETLTLDGSKRLPFIQLPRRMQA
jgi:hypothetical protein